MKPNIHKHLLGVYTALRARIELINSSIGHSATQGAENEEEIRALLLDFLPSGYGIGSGMIIDTEGNTTKQIDIIIYDKQRADYTLSASSKIFLADHVIAAIEIKTTYTTSVLEEALENIASVRRLKVVNRPWVDGKYNGETESFEFTRYTPHPPLGIIFFFRIPDTRSPVDLDQFFATLRERLARVPLELQPDMLFSLGHASYFRHGDIARADLSLRQCGTFLVQIADAPNMRVGLGDPPQSMLALVDFGESEFAANREIHVTPIDDARGKTRLQIISDEVQGLNPMIYRTAKFQDTVCLLDSFRAFITFIWVVDALISMKAMSSVWTVADYFGATFLESFIYPDELGEAVAAEPVAPPGYPDADEAQQ